MSDDAGTEELPDPWDHESLVLAWNKACEGMPIGEIAKLMGRSVHDVARLLDPETKPRRTSLPAAVGYPHIKERYR